MIYNTRNLFYWLERLCLILICVGSGNVFASPLSFKQLNTPAILPTNEIRNLFQDSEGYVWISTYNGLLRYDGYSTITYKASSGSGEHFVDGFVNVVDEDKEHNLWIGTHNGLFRLDKQTDCIERVVSVGLHVSFVEAVKCLSNGDVWIGSNQGLFYKKRGSRDFVRFHPSRNFDVKSILEDHKGNVWFGTWSQGLFRYAPDEDKLYEYTDINQGKSAHILFQDKDLSIWVGTWRYGVVKVENPYDMENYSYVRYRHDATDAGSLSDDIVYSIAQDRNTGNIWFGTRKGLSIYVPGMDGFENYYPDMRKNGLPFGEVDALLCSEDGLMWIGMLGGGICTVNTRQKQFGYDSLEAVRKYNLSSSVRCIFQKGKDNLWMGIMGFGFVDYNLKTGRVIPYQMMQAFSGLPHISAVNEIIVRHSTGEYCLATWDDGVWLYDGDRVKVVNRDMFPKLSDYCIYSVFEDTKGNLWIGSRAGLYVLNKANQLFSLNELLAEKGKMLPEVSIFKICEDKKGNIWVATPTSGVWKLTEVCGKYEVRRYSSDLHNASMVGAMTLCADSYGRIWVGTNGNGVSLYDEDKDCFFTPLDEYFDEEVIYCMLEGQSGEMWLTSNSEMFHVIYPLDSSDVKIHIYTVEDGLQDYVFNRNACFKDEIGKLYFGGVKGINVFSPKEIIYDTLSYPVVITDLKIYNTSVREMTKQTVGTIMSETLDYTSHIILDYKQNNFSLDFSILNYINPQLNKYEYQLEGYDAAWISAYADRHFAYYSNLPAGEYVFKVKGANANGVWSEKIRMLKITILPPPWLSWWAYCLYVLAVALLLVAVYKVMRKRVTLQHMVELAVMQQQKHEEINHLKLQFFTNITHELLTPLTIISASVEDLKLHVPEVGSRLCEIEDNLLRLIRLIQQVLEFRKVESGCQQLRVSYGNLTLLLRRSALAFAPLVRKKGLRLMLEGDEQEISGYFDIDKVDKIIYNLLSNAAKYTLEGGVICLKQWYDNSNQTFMFSVNNPGEVISQEKLAHIFERFYEGNYRKFHTSGTGIGLSLTQDLVLLHHGTISVDSNEEDGITFTVSLPIGRGVFRDDELDETVNGNMEYDENEKGDLTVNQDNFILLGKDEHKDKKGLPSLLLVEDNEDLRRVIRRILGDFFLVTDVANGEQAWEELQEHRIDIVVSDVMMDGMNGFELCRRIKDGFDTRHIPVILLTARTTDKDRIEGYEVGADGYICKPLNINVLLAKIDNLLKKCMNGPTDARKKLVFEAKGLEYTDQDEVFLKKVLDCVNEHLSDVDFDTITLVESVGMSRTAFNEKMKKLTGMTPVAFVSSIRLQTAFRLLQEQKKIRITDLAYAVGFNDPKYFSQCFKKKFGFLPKEYQERKD